MTRWRTIFYLLLVAVLGATWGTVADAAPAAAPLAAPPVHGISVTGTGVGTYPAFDPSIARYGVTTTAATGGTLTVTATTSDPAGVVTVNGRIAPGGTRTLTGLSAGDEVAVFITDSEGTARHSFVYLPARFPALERVTPTPAPGALAPGLVLLTIGLWVEQSPFFETAVDVNGVPAFVHETENSIDLQVQPNGRYSVFRPTAEPGRTGDDLIELDSQYHEVARHRTVNLVNTDGHDAIVQPDGTVWLTAYEPNDVTGLTDAVIQRIDPDGTVGFTWNSADFASETVEEGDDYAHINSIQLLPGGDLLASFRHLSSVYRIATSDHDGFDVGEVVWKLGGRDSDFTFPTPGDIGPCAQHTARMLPNGHVLMFDNGSWSLNTFCVDPQDPSGPTIERAQTRIVEYELDTAAGTATVVGSYEPAGRFALFAGSAQRLGNGNTVIGWAAATQALASEIGPDGTLLWELRDPGAAPKWFTYRAHKAVAPDAIPPEVEVTVPAAGATYVEGAVSPSYDCTDRGGSSLQSCTMTPFDTSPGSHTVSVTATDGAGGTTTVTRHYTVLVGSRPDVMARPRGAAAYAGDGVYAPDAQQVRARVRRSAKLQVRVQNDGARADTLTWSVGRSGRFVLRGPRTGTTPLLQPGESWTFVLRAHPKEQGSGRRVARVPVQVTSALTARSDTLIWRLKPH